MPYQSLRPMAAAAGPQAPSKVQRKPTDTSTQPSVKAAKKSEYVKSGACERCRKGKRKCDGGKPVCDACRKRGIGPEEKCVYQNLEGLSRIETLKHNAQTLKKERDLLRAVIKDIASSQQGDSSSNEVIERLKAPGMDGALGVEITELLQSKGGSIHSGWPAESSITPADPPPPAHANMSSFSGSDNCEFNTTPPDSPEKGYGASAFGMPFGGYWSKNPGEVSSKTMGAFIPQQSFAPRTSQIELTSLQTAKYSSSAAMSTASSVSMSPTHSLQPLRTTTADDLNVYSPGQHDHDYDGARSRITSLDEEDGNFVRPDPKRQKKADTTQRAAARLYRQMPAGSSIQTNGFPPDVQKSQMLNYVVPEYMIQPLVVPSESPFSLALASFRDTARQRISQGWSREQILGPVDFDMSRLVFKDTDTSYNPTVDNEFSVPAWAVNIVSTFPVTEPASLIAGAYQVAGVMRWLIDPTPANYELIFEHMRPTRGSRFVPHATELDFIAVPGLREALIKRPRDFMAAFLEHGSWDWPEDKPCTRLDPRTGHRILTPEFKAYIRNGWNWGFKKEFFDIVPELEGKCRIRD